MSDEAKQKISLALIEEGGKFLLIRRRMPEGKLQWAFPGGHVEDGETDIQAAIREAKAETGVEVIVKEKLFERKHPDTGRYISYISCAVMGSTDFNISEPDEVAEAEWVVAQEVLPRFTSDVHPIIRNYVMSYVTEDFI